MYIDQASFSMYLTKDLTSSSKRPTSDLPCDQLKQRQRKSEQLFRWDKREIILVIKWQIVRISIV